MNKKLILSILGLILLSALFLRVRSSLPVISVDSSKLSWEDFNKEKDGYMRFRDLNKDNISDEDIEKGVLLSFVESSLIKDELERNGKGKDFVDKMVEGSISENDREKIETATSQLYGWNLNDFKKFVLEPQARRTLADEVFASQNEDFETWLEKTMPEANISIYLWRWKWTGSDIEKRF